MHQFFTALLDAGLDCWPLPFVAGLVRDMKNICACVPLLASGMQRPWKANVCGQRVGERSESTENLCSDVLGVSRVGIIWISD